MMLSPSFWEWSDRARNDITLPSEMTSTLSLFPACLGRGYCSRDKFLWQSLSGRRHPGQGNLQVSIMRAYSRQTLAWPDIRYSPVRSTRHYWQLDGIIPPTYTPISCIIEPYTFKEWEERKGKDGLKDKVNPKELRSSKIANNVWALIR